MTERDLLHEPCDILIPCAVERVSRLLVLCFSFGGFPRILQFVSKYHLEQC